MFLFDQIKIIWSLRNVCQVENFLNLSEKNQENATPKNWKFLSDKLVQLIKSVVNTHVKNLDGLTTELNVTMHNVTGARSFLKER